MDTIDLIVTLCFLHCCQRNPHLKSKRWQKQVGFFSQFHVKPQQYVCYLRGEKTLCGGQGLLPVSGWDVSSTNLLGKAKLSVRINITVGLRSC